MARVESDFDYTFPTLADGFPHLKSIISKFFFEVFTYPSNFTSYEILARCMYLYTYSLTFLQLFPQKLLPIHLEARPQLFFVMGHSQIMLAVDTIQGRGIFK